MWITKEHKQHWDYVATASLDPADISENIYIYIFFYFFVIVVHQQSGQAAHSLTAPSQTQCRGADVCQHKRLPGQTRDGCAK